MSAQPVCFLAQFSDRPCNGRLVRCHLIPRQLLRREFGRDLGRELAEDPASWVWGCGGIVGNAGHHGAMDAARTLRIPRDRLPESFIRFCDDLGLGWWVDREYPEQIASAA